MMLRLILLTALFSAAMPACAETRLKDIVDVEGVRGNDLVGYGLVVGLNGTGDGLKNSPFTEEALSSFLERLGINVQGEDFRPRNVAAVVATAVLPPFARAGSQIDVTVSAIGDARSLLGGTLIMTPLNAPDGQVYAVAQGPVLASGVSAGGAAASLTFGVPTTGSIPRGARVEREVKLDFSKMTRILLALHSPDFSTAAAIEAAINRVAPGAARVSDPGTIEIDVAGSGFEPVPLLARIENLLITPEQKARIVIDQKSGTVVLGSNVRISDFAVTQGNLAISVRERFDASQPNPFSSTGETVVLPDTDVAIDRGRPDNIAAVADGTTLSDLVEGLNALGVGPRDLIDILKAVKASGALHAEIIVM